MSDGDAQDVLRLRSTISCSRRSVSPPPVPAAAAAAPASPRPAARLHGNAVAAARCQPVSSRAGGGRMAPDSERSMRDTGSGHSRSTQPTKRCPLPVMLLLPVTLPVMLPFPV